MSAEEQTNPTPAEPVVLEEAVEVGATTETAVSDPSTVAKATAAPSAPSAPSVPSAAASASASATSIPVKTKAPLTKRQMIKVEGLSGAVSEEDLRAAFRIFGELGMISYEDTFRDTATIRYTKVEDAAKATVALNGTEINGKKIQVTHPEANSVVFAGNLPTDFAEDSIRRWFGEFGSVERVVLVRNDDGASKGYAIIEFKTAEEALNAKQNAHLRSIKDRNPRVDWFEWRVGAEFHARMIFVDRLPRDFKDESVLKEFFQLQGPVRDCYISVGPNLLSRGFAFVEFEKHEDAEKARLNLQDAEFHGAKLRISYCNPLKSVSSMRGGPLVSRLGTGVGRGNYESPIRPGMSYGQFRPEYDPRERDPRLMGHGRGYHPSDRREDPYGRGRPFLPHEAVRDDHYGARPGLVGARDARSPYQNNAPYKDPSAPQGYSAPGYNQVNRNNFPPAAQRYQPPAAQVPVPGISNPIAAQPDYANRQPYQPPVANPVATTPASAAYGRYQDPAQPIAGVKRPADTYAQPRPAVNATNIPLSTQPNYGASAQQASYGSAQPAYGAVAQTYGATPQQQYGSAAQTGYAAATQQSYGSAPQTGYGNAGQQTTYAQGAQQASQSYYYSSQQTPYSQTYPTQQTTAQPQAASYATQYATPAATYDTSAATAATSYGGYAQQYQQTQPQTQAPLGYASPYNQSMAYDATKRPRY